MVDLTCPKCLKKTLHTNLEYQAQYTQTRCGNRISKFRAQRIGEWVRCGMCSLTYLSLSEGKATNDGTIGTGDL